MFAKAQIAKLSAEDQELLARLELSKARQRQELLAQARGLDWRSRYFPLFNLAVFIIAAVFYSFDFFHLKQNQIFLLLVVGAIFINALHFHNARVNRRLDALLELLELDRKLQNSGDGSKDEKPAEVAPE
jgi:hypothetical protein